LSLDEAFARVVSEKEASLFRPSASQVAAAAKEYGYLEIIVFPSMDSLVAAAIAARVLRSNGVGFSIRIEPVAPKSLEEPTLLLGYPASIAAELTVRRPSALIGYGERPQGILPLAVTSANDSSIAALAFGVFSEIAIVGSFGIYALAAGYWKGLDRGKRAEFIGVENTILEMLKLENKVEEFFSLRLYRWPEVVTERALYLTISPFFVGITGRQEKAEAFLRSDPRLEPLIGKTLSEAPEQAVAVLGEKLYELLKATSRIPRRPTEIIGYSYYSRASLLPDLREAGYILAHYAGLDNAARLTGLAFDEEGVAADAHYSYRKVFSDIVDYVEPLIASKLDHRREGKLQVAELPGEVPSHPLVEKILYQHGALAAEAVSSSGGRMLAETVVERVGYAVFAEMMTRGCLRYVENTLYVEVGSGEC
jgi:single-stranded-DNA-specific exonuclease